LGAKQERRPFQDGDTARVVHQVLHRQAEGAEPKNLKEVRAAHEEPQGIGPDA
jgi:hypothetical protein